MAGNGFVGLRIDGRVVTNGQARDVLRSVYQDEVVRCSKEYGFPCSVLLESTAALRGLPYRHGEGSVRGSFSGDDYSPEMLTIVLSDDFFDASKSDEPVDAFAFFGGVVCMDHECHHVWQHMYMERQDTPLGKFLFLNTFGLGENTLLGRHLYPWDPNEIDAHMASLASLRDRMDRYGSVELVDVECMADGCRIGSVRHDLMRDTPGDTAVCFYQARHHERSSMDWIPMPDGGYESADQVFRLCEDRFVESIVRKKDWRFDFKEGEPVPETYYDGIRDYIDRCPEPLARYFREHPLRRFMFLGASDGIVQLCMMASAALESVPDVALDMGTGRTETLREVSVRHVKERFGLDVSTGATFGWSRMLGSLLSGDGITGDKSEVEVAVDGLVRGNRPLPRCQGRSGGNDGPDAGADGPEGP